MAKAKKTTIKVDPAEAKQRLLKTLPILKKTYPDAKIALNWENPWNLLVAVILSAQCTDVRVNIVTKDLFKKYKKPQDYLAVEAEELEQDIRPTGFYRNKAKNIRGAAAKVIEDFNGSVPATMEELLTLPGAGRKTANCILGNAYGIPGITCDTHVIRLSRRLGLSENSDPVKLEFDLMDIVPKKKVRRLDHVFALYHLPRPQHLQSPKTRLPKLPHRQTLSLCQQSRPVVNP